MVTGSGYRRAAPPTGHGFPPDGRHGRHADADAPTSSVPLGVLAPAADTSWTTTVRAGYAFDGPTLTLGALTTDDGPVPGAPVRLPLATLNRHGLVAGATGTGKTRTLQVLAEGLSAAGVPVFLTDVKGDLSGIAEPGTPSAGLLARTEAIGQEWAPAAHPVELLSLGGVGTGTPVRTTVTDFGPLLLARVLELNRTQESSLALVFHWADSQGLALLDLHDLRSTITFLVSDEGRSELKGIGGLSTATAGVILRQVVALQAQGADAFFGEPAFDTAELLRTTEGATPRGVVSALQLPAVQDRPRLFSTFLMWLLADLFGALPEVGDTERPRLVFIFDEAHLLFTGASKGFLAEVTQTVRLIRSKGVGVFFVTQTPKDVPRDVLAQLGTRVQHALRAHTPEDGTALRATARTFPRSDHDLEELLPRLGTGEAVVTGLGEDGSPTPVARTTIAAPTSAMDPLDEAGAAALVARSPLRTRYGTPVDRESAHELLQARAELAAARAEEEARVAAERAEAERRARELERLERSSRREGTSSASRRRPASALDPLLRSMGRSVGSALGREITRTIFGTRRR